MRRSSGSVRHPAGSWISRRRLPPAGLQHGARLDKITCIPTGSALRGDAVIGVRQHTMDNQPIKRRALLLLNPRSRSGGDRAPDAAVQQLERGGLILTRGLCARSADITREVIRHAHEVDLVIVGGGDGTVNAVLKGMLPKTALFRHALRNALIPIATRMSEIFTLVFAGALLIEKVFDIDGMGLLVWNSIVSRDYNVVMGIILISSLLTLFGRLFSDLLYTYIDPRIRLQ